ncbi:hypothetical protein [Tomitella gaofuii]|uniref:hypothetical protein n=1 Tax=Tomitella gaofuii TaxID=2760083 RepID=UPI0015FE7EC2|nr:hypothetical protein [Tomitella gaofuii]
MSEDDANASGTEGERRSHSSAWTAAPLAVWAFAFALIRMLPRRFPLRRVLGLAMARVGLVGGGGVLIAAAFVQTPWVPLEHIGTTDGELIGYVMSVDPGFVNVLTEDQEFVILPVDSVLSRE